MKKFLNSAFTMAEAILVMTILGIIATIMISTLKPAEFKEKGMQVMAKKVLSEIDVATTQILLNNTADGTFERIYEAGSANILNGVSDGLSVLYKRYLTTLRKEPEAFFLIGPKFLLKDGASVAVMYKGPCDGALSGWLTIFPGETNTVSQDCPCGAIEFDINDNEPPNVYGKDKFSFCLDRQGIKYSE